MAIITFQDKYQKLLADLDTKIEDRKNNFANDTSEKFDIVDRNNIHLQKEIYREKADRLKENEDNLNKLNAAIQNVEDCVKAEVEVREKTDSKIYQKIADSNKALNDILDSARAEREQKIKDVKDLHEYEVLQQKKLVDDFSKKV